MSGGIAYVLDEDRSFYKRLNKELVSFEDVSNKYDVLELKGLIQEHVAYTNSEKGKRILDHFSEYLPKFKNPVIFPIFDASLTSDVYIKCFNLCLLTV